MKRRPLLFLMSGVLALCCHAGHVWADADSDNRALLERVIELETEVKSISQKTYSQGYTPGATAVTSTTTANGTPLKSADMSAPDVETRLNSLENQLRNLTGQVEQATYQSQQTNTALQKLSSDMDFRLQQLEQHQGAAAQANPANNASPPQTAGGLPPAVMAPNDPNAPLANVAAPSAVIANTAAGLPPAVNQDAPGSPEELYNRAYSEMQRKDYQTAQTDFKNFLSGNPASRLAPNAEYWLGEIYYAQGNYKLASATFADGYQKAPKGAKAADNLYKLGLSLEQQNRNKDACTVLRELTKEYPTASDTITTGAARGIKRMQCTTGA